MAVLSRRTNRTEASRETTREAILRATIDLLARGPAFVDISIGEISSAAGVSRPTFYAYFRDKRALILALGDIFERDAHAASAAWMELRDDDVRAALEAVYTVFAEHRHTIRAVTEAAGYDPEVASFWRGFHERYMNDVVRRLLRSDPDRPPEDAEAQAYVLIWMTERSFSEHLLAPRVGNAALIRSVEHLWRSTLE